MEQSERDILIRCQHGDKEAFRTIVRNYQRMIFSLSLKMLCDEDEAKDAVQETFIRAWQNIDSYDIRRPLSTWLYTIGTRLCLDRIKSRRRFAPLPADENALARFAADTDSQLTLENNEWISIVRLLVEKLSTMQQTVFTLSQLEGLSAAEIEQITGLDATQIKSNLYVARQTIRKQLKELGYE